MYSRQMNSVMKKGKKTTTFMLASTDEMSYNCKGR